MSSYDQALLDEAPKASRAQLQQGYDANLLEPARRTPSVRRPHSQTPQPTPVPLTPGIAESSPEEKITSLSHPEAPRPSFWHSRSGVITLLVIAIVVVAAVVGGAVGGTVNHHGHKDVVSSTKASGPTSSSYPTPSPSSLIPSSTITSYLSAGIGGQPSSTTAPNAVSSPPSEDNIQIAEAARII